MWDPVPSVPKSSTDRTPHAGANTTTPMKHAKRYGTCSKLVVLAQQLGPHETASRQKSEKYFRVVRSFLTSPLILTPTLKRLNFFLDEIIFLKTLLRRKSTFFYYRRTGVRPLTSLVRDALVSGRGCNATRIQFRRRRSK